MVGERRRTGGGGGGGGGVWRGDAAAAAAGRRRRRGRRRRSRRTSCPRPWSSAAAPLVVAVNYHGVIIAVDPADGTIRWRASLASAGEYVDGVAASPGIGKDGSIYVPDYEGSLHAFIGNGGCPRDTTTRPCPPRLCGSRGCRRRRRWNRRRRRRSRRRRRRRRRCRRRREIRPRARLPPPPPLPPPPFAPSPPPPPQAPAVDYVEECLPCPSGHVTGRANLASACEYCKGGSQASSPDAD